MIAQYIDNDGKPFAKVKTAEAQVLSDCANLWLCHLSRINILATSRSDVDEIVNTIIAATAIAPQEQGFIVYIL